MKTLYGYRNLKNKLRDPIVAIGIFDGIHVGHKRVIKKVLSPRDSARDRVVMTFSPHPENVLRPRKTPPRIMSLEHRLLIFRKMGLDAAIILRFSRHFASMSPEDFVRLVLIGGIGTRTVYVGHDFHFGRGKSGNIRRFRELGKKYGVEVRTVPPVKHRGRPVSSTWLRNLIKAGNIKRAEILLRRPVSVLGTVVSGDKRGKVLGVPTANVDPHQEVMPPPGVYAVKIDIDGRLCDGVLNIGFRPTFYGRRLKKRREPHIEAHVLGFDGDLYGRALEIFFITKLRRERKFKSEERLKKQIEKDIAAARKLLDNEKVLKKIKKYKYL